MELELEEVIKIKDILANVERLREKNTDTSTVLSTEGHKNLAETLSSYRVALEKKWSDAGAKLPEGTSSATREALSKLQDQGLGRSMPEVDKVTIVGQDTP